MESSLVEPLDPRADRDFELFDRKRWATRIELATALFEYLEIFHNRQRRHSSLGMMTPVEYELHHGTTAVG